MRIALHTLYILFHLIPSERDQKVEAKPKDSFLWERSQRWAVKPSDDVAGLTSVMGSLLGRSCGRASLSRAKSGLLASFVRGPCAVCSVSGGAMTPVRHAITSGIWNIQLTGELPRCLGPHSEGPVRPSYKSPTKGWGHAPVAGTASPRPRLWGSQQSQSSPEFSPDERQNLRVSWAPPGSMGIVSSAAAATKWPERTSSFQPADGLRNLPQQPRLVPTTVRQRLTTS